MKKWKLTRCLCMAAAAALLAAPAMATTIDEARIDANCEGYSITFFGSGFEPGEIIETDYKITIAALTPDNEDVVVFGNATLDSTGCVPEADRTTCDITVTDSRTWEEALGNPLPCGDYQLLYNEIKPDCDLKPTFYRYTTPFGSVLCEDPTPVDGWDGFLECPCDEPGLLCRTPGFWGTHAGAAKKNSQNITQQVIDAAMMGIEVCGAPVATTMLDSGDSALEALCVSPSGEKRLQMIFQLTATALNCVMTNGNGDCFDVGIGADFEACNMACASDDLASFDDCIDALDCFNNGGRLLANGMCQLGTCADSGEACDDDDACGLDDLGYPVSCVPLEGNCHDRPLVNADLGLNFDPPGPAGSSKACNDANANDCTLLGGCTN